MADTRRQGIARIICAMTYGELMELAEELSRMIEPNVRPKIETPEEFASAFHDWAEANDPHGELGS